MLKNIGKGALLEDLKAICLLGIQVKKEATSDLSEQLHSIS